MKKHLLALILLSLIYSFSCAQDQELSSIKDFYFQAYALSTFYEYIPESTKLGTQKGTFSPLDFDIENPDPVTISNVKYFIIKFYPIEDEGTLQAQSKDDSMLPLKGHPYYINSEDNGKFFLIEAKRITSDSAISKYIKTKLAWVYGANLSTPFKYRPPVGNINYVFYPEVTLGGYFGWKLPLDKIGVKFLYLVGSAGFSSIQINSQNEKDSNSNSGMAWGFSESIGLVAQLSSDFQIGLLWGHDFVSGDIGKNWLYNQMPWYSIGIGYSFLGGEKTNTNKVNKAKQDAREKVNALSNKADLPNENPKSIPIKEN